jgi:hypothetical protein
VTGLATMSPQLFKETGVKAQDVLESRLSWINSEISNNEIHLTVLRRERKDILDGLQEIVRLIKSGEN